MAGKPATRIDVTTGVGTIAFPRVFASTAGKNDKGDMTYDIQIIIPKSQRDDVRAIFAAIKKVGEDKWGPKWKQVRSPLRDGDAEKDELTEDGTPKGEKYPERLGCYFINARSTKPVGVYDRQRNLITEPSDLYSGCKGQIAVTFYAYSNSGNLGIGAGLNGVRKVADGESLGGGGKPSVESMFDLLDDDDLDLEDGVDEEIEEVEEAPKSRAKTRRTKAAPEPVEDDEDDDLYGDLDDLDD